MTWTERYRRLVAAKPLFYSTFFEPESSQAFLSSPTILFIFVAPKKNRSCISDTRYNFFRRGWHMSGANRASRSKTSFAMANAELVSLIKTSVREEISAGLEIHLQPIKDDMRKIQQNVTSCLDKIASLEVGANETDLRLSKLEQKNKSLADEVLSLRRKTDSLENYSRKLNIKVYNLPEQIEMGNPTTFVNGMLAALFGHDIGPPPYVNIAHRIGAVNKDKPRCLFAKLNNSDIRQKVVRLAGDRAKAPGRLLYEGHRINIVRDITVEQRKLQSSFDELRSLLRGTDLRYGVAYPAKMLITFQGKTHSFTDPAKAMNFYTTQIKPTLVTDASSSLGGAAAEDDSTSSTQE